MTGNWGGRLREVARSASRTSLGAAIGLAILVRVGAGLVFSAGSTETYEFGAIATNVVEGRGYSYFPTDGESGLLPHEATAESAWLPSAYMPPLYTYLVAGAAEVVGTAHDDLVWGVRALNLLLAAATVTALYALTRRLTGSTSAARLAALGVAVYPPAVYAATQVSAANLYIPLQMLALSLLLVAAASRSPWRWLGAGAVIGVLGLARAEMVVLLPVVVLWLWWAAGPAIPARAVRGGLVALFVLGATALPAAWLVRNAATFGEPTYAIATSGGLNLWIGNHDGATGSQKSTAIPDDLQRRLAELPPTDDFELRRDALFREVTIDEITADPLGTALRDVKKVGLLLGADVYDRRSLNPISLGAWVALAAIGTLGLRDWWRRRDQPTATRVLVAGFLAVNVAVPIAFFALARYKLPIEVMLLVFASAWFTATGAQRTSSSPSAASTVTVPPSTTLPSSTSMASGSATWRWITRLSGRAPNAGS